MKFTDAAFHTIINQRNLRQQRIDELVAKYQPKVIRTYNENGHQVSVIQPMYAEGACCGHRVKSTGRGGGEYDF